VKSIQPVLIALLTSLLLLPSAGSWAQDEAAEAPEATEPPPAAAADPAEADADASAAKPQSSCVECHSQQDKSKEILSQFSGSIHAELDFGCADCHGGDDSSMDLMTAKDPAKGYIGKPDRSKIPELCGRCHSDATRMKQYGNVRTDQLSLYKTSAHGIALFSKGDTNVAVCTDCHTVHDIQRVNNPKSTVHKLKQAETCAQCHGKPELMDKYELSADIPGEYLAGEHAIRIFEHDDMGAPVCSDCHGSHGATPPGVATIQNVCGNCHLATEKQYNSSPHAQAFADLGLGRCIVCHSQHKLEKPSDDFLSAEATPSCLVCHTEDSEQYKTIAAMRKTITDIKGLHEEAAALVEETEHETHLSMYEMIPQVEQINTLLLKARGLQHAGDLKLMEDNLGEAHASFGTIEAFTVKLLERSKFNKTMVILLAVLLLGFGIFMFVYRRLVLDQIHPWVSYEGAPVDAGANQHSKEG
jgi:hypothetical protein